MGKRPTGLYRRGNNLYVRKRVPDNIRSIIGKSEIWVSLKSPDFEKVKADFWDISAKIEKQFDRAQKSLKKTEPLLLTPAMSERFALIWFGEKIYEECEEVRNSLTPFDENELLKELGLEEREFHTAPEDVATQYLSNTADEILLANGFPTISLKMRKRTYLYPNVDKSSEGYCALLSFVKRGMLESIERRRNIVKKLPYGTCFDPLFQEVLDQPENTKLEVNNPLTLEAAINEFLDLNIGRSERTVLNINAAFRPLLEVVNPSTPINEMTRNNFYDVFNLIGRLPPNATKGQNRIGKSLTEIALENDSSGGPKLNPTTVNKYMAQISTFVQWAQDDGLVDRNLANGKHLRAKKNRVDSGMNKRDAFVGGQLSAIFSTDKYIEPLPTKPSFYWLPLISLFHGMRMEEILQLSWRDMQSEGNIEFLRLHANGSNRLKNANAVRDIPIHPKMNELRFDTLVTAAKKREDGRLFHDVRRGPEGKFSSIFSQRYSRHLVRIQVKTTKTSFHSFRHNFRDAGRNCQVPDDRICSIGGWEYGTGTQANYGSGLNLLEKAKAIAMIEYLDVDFSKIRVIDWSKC